MSEPDRTNLPIRRLPFQGVSNKTLDGSKPDWNLIGHPEAPPGSPNVLLVLIDDAGFGNPSTFGGPISTPRYTQMAETGLRYNRSTSPRCVPRRARLCSPGGTTMRSASAPSVSSRAASPATRPRFPAIARPCRGS